MLLIRGVWVWSAVHRLLLCKAQHVCGVVSSCEGRLCVSVNTSCVFLSNLPVLPCQLTIPLSKGETCKALATALQVLVAQHGASLLIVV